jgi:hypothetical protein
MSESIVIVKKNDDGKFIHKKITDSNDIKKIQSISHNAKSRDFETILKEVIESNNSLVDRVEELERFRHKTETILSDLHSTLMSQEERLEDLEEMKRQWDRCEAFARKRNIMK